jgi:hypothetical protein
MTLNTVISKQLHLPLCHLLRAASDANKHAQNAQ